MSFTSSKTVALKAARSFVLPLTIFSLSLCLFGEVGDVGAMT